MFGSSQWMYSSGGGSFYGTEIDGSLRFNDGDSAYLTQTPSVEGNRDTWTWSCWFKIGVPATQISFFGGYANSNDRDVFRLESNGTLSYQLIHSGNIDYVTTNAVFRDHSAWYHVVLAVDLTQGTQSNRGKIWINGVQQSLSTNDLPDSSSNTKFTDDRLRYLGARSFDGNPSGYFDGYMAEIHFCDGTAYDADDFGELKSGVWVPKSPSVSYGTTGFHLEFAGNANDSSGNSNNFTANNITSADYVSDSPTDNFATWNPLDKASGATLSDGNLLWTDTDSWASIRATFGLSSGKWYWECTGTSGSNFRLFVGIADASVSLAANTNLGDHDGAFSYYSATGAKYSAGIGGGSGGTSYGATFTAGDVIGVALDMDAGTLTFYKNNSSQGTAFTGLSGTYFPAITSETSGCRVNFGQSGFTYTPPTGYLALCTANLTVAEAVDPAEDNSPQDYFNTVLYTGNGSTQSITGVGFQPDFVWGKERSSTSTPTIYDAVRGATKMLNSSGTDAESTVSNQLTSFDSDGFSLGNSGGINENNQTYVAWNWKANGSGVDATDQMGGAGTGASATISANTEVGFSIIKYTIGTSPDAYKTIPHGLGVKPEVLIVKRTNASGNNWAVWHHEMGDNKYVSLNTTSSENTDITVFRTGSDYTNSTTFGVRDTLTGGEGNTYICYAFKGIEGFSKFGSYIGNGNADGPFVYTGFRPAFVLIKCFSEARPWAIFDTDRDAYNVAKKVLSPDSNRAEFDNEELDIDILSNGFKGRFAASETNGSGKSYVYMAFAENPFKYANAR